MNDLRVNTFSLHPPPPHYFSPHFPAWNAPGIPIEVERGLVIGLGLPSGRGEGVPFQPGVGGHDFRPHIIHWSCFVVRV